jgi:phospholipase C
MSGTDRRTFLKLLSAGSLVAAMPESIAKALAIPANNATGTIADVEHIVILMQENRSFDHYFGTLKGVRGFSDPRAVKLPTGNSVWEQPGLLGLGTILPFHPTAPDLGLQFLEDLPHDWDTTHGAWNNGAYDQWVPNKGTTTMAHMERSDIPYQYALADAFTICDAYHCSLLGPTDPNRYYMFSGWVGNDGSGGGPVIDNSESGYSWTTYPELLEAAGVSWKVYQDIGDGLNAANGWGDTSDAYIGNYGDNSLLYFTQYQNAQPGNPLADKAKTGTNVAVSGTLFDQLSADVLANTLPQVSWIVAPEAYTEHPNWPANYGAWYVSQVLDALTSNPEVWSKTAFFITYDENDGFFDHMIPPTPPTSSSGGISTVDTVNEIYPGTLTNPQGPYGMGVRVPMLVISPWSKGGYVNSQVFDHTSLIRFIEQRFGTQYPGIMESNITPWRRAVSGDLTSAFNFATPNAANVTLPSTASYVPPDNNRHASYYPLPPLVQALPAQESGTRPARALPYQLDAWGIANSSNGTFSITFANTGKVAVVFHVRSGDILQQPRNYTVGPGQQVTDTWSVTLLGRCYDLSVYGPNGFLRAFKGSVAGSTNANLTLTSSYNTSSSGISLNITGNGGRTGTVLLQNAYTGVTISQLLVEGQTATVSLPLTATSGWYDLIATFDQDPAFRQHLAGHVETGLDSISDPAIGATAKAS